MLPVLLLLLLQADRTVRLAERPVDDSYSVVLMQARTGELIREKLVLQARNNRNLYWDLEELRESAPCHTLKRADRNSVVLFCANDYGHGNFLKLFFDSRSKRVLKRVKFEDTSLSLINATELQRVLETSSDLVAELLKPLRPQPLPPTVLPIPQSTYEEFARARPERVRDGYDRNSTEIMEEIGPYIVSDNRLWFGKRFYDGEGVTGVGAIGYFDTTAKKYSFLRIPEVTNWSVSSIFLEENLLWASLVRHPEGADYSGGLLLHNLKTGMTRKYAVDDVVSKIVRGQDGLYIATENGLYVLKGDEITRHRVEPDFNGKPAIYSEQLP